MRNGELSVDKMAGGGARGKRNRDVNNVCDQGSITIMRDRTWPCRAPCFAFDDFPLVDEESRTAALSINSLYAFVSTF